MNTETFQNLIEKFTQNVHRIFEHSAPLMSISPVLARRLGLKIWTQFEQSVSQTLLLANEICDIALATSSSSNSDNCMLLKMQELGMTSDMIKRIFVDLLIAAGDTVHANNLSSFFIAR